MLAQTRILCYYYSMDNSLEKPVVQNGTPRRRNSRLAIIVVAVLLVAGIVAFIIILNKHNSPSTNDSGSTSSGTEKPAESSEKKEEVKKAEKESGKETEQKEPEQKSEDIIEGKTPVNQDGDANSGETLTGVINYAAVNDGTLMIRVSIDQYLESGECLLELNSPSDSFTLTDQIAPSAATSTCSYDIATSLLEEGSKYDIKITVTSGDKKGIIKGEVDV